MNRFLAKIRGLFSAETPDTPTTDQLNSVVNVVGQNLADIDMLYQMIDARDSQLLHLYHVLNIDPMAAFVDETFHLEIHETKRGDAVPFGDVTVVSDDASD